MVKKTILKKYLQSETYDKINSKKLQIKEYKSKKGWYYMDYNCDTVSECDIAMEILNLMHNKEFEEELNNAIKNKMSKM